MIFSSPGAVLCSFGPFTLRWYGLLTAIAFLVAYNVATRLLKYPSKKISEQELSDFCILILISGLIGARLWFVILNYDYYIANLVEVPQIWLGGQSIQGGLIGASIGSYIFNRNKDFLLKMSLVVTVLPLAQAIGRWGNFFNEEAYGSITQLPWGLYISTTGKFHHPTFLYESILNIVIFVTMLFLFKYLHTRLSIYSASMKLIAAYLFFYGIVRLCVESIRVDSLLIAGMPAASLLSVIAILLGLGIWLVDWLRSRLVK